MIILSLQQKMANNTMNTIAPNYPYIGLLNYSPPLSLPLSALSPFVNKFVITNKVKTSCSPFPQTYLSLLSLKSTDYRVSFSTYLSHVTFLHFLLCIIITYTILLNIELCIGCTIRFISSSK